MLNEKFRLEEFDEEIVNSATFRQGDGLATIKSTFNPEDKPTDYWTITHYKCKNIRNVPSKER